MLARRWISVAAVRASPSACSPSVVLCSSKRFGHVQPALPNRDEIEEIDPTPTSPAQLSSNWGESKESSLSASTSSSSPTLFAKSVDRRSTAQLQPINNSPVSARARRKVVAETGVAEAPVSLLSRDSHLDSWTKMDTLNAAAASGTSTRSSLSAYMQLAKWKLSLLVTSTASAGYALAPASFELQSFALCSLGTFLLSASANTCNQLFEAPYDAQMKRTAQRMLVIQKVSPLQALGFATCSAAAGTVALASLPNGGLLAASLGLANLVIYAGIYTPMKRYHVACTWAGAVVGAIPPLIGWASCTGTLDPAAGCLAAMLFAWQFPHFNGLSWNLRGDYSRAGYRVMCVTNEQLTRASTIRYAVALTALCAVGAPLTDLAPPLFALDSAPLNAYLLWLSYDFYRAPSAKNSRKLFFYSLLYLPLLLGLLGISKYGRSNDQKTVTAELVAEPQ